MSIDYPTREEVPQLRKLWTSVFGDGDDFLDTFFSTAFAPDRCRCLWEGNDLGASLYWFDVSCQGAKLAYIYAVGTAPTHRNRGLCRLLMDDTLKILQSRGYAGAILVPAGEKLFEMYGKMGFEFCSSVLEFHAEAGSLPCDLQEIPVKDYVNLRRKFLPEGAVLQEGENMTFLQTQAKFFHNDKCLLAASIDGSQLRCHEILGDTTLAPRILAKLGCEKGFFRTVGDDKPFSMYCPVTPACPHPTYFAFAFD